MRNCIVSLLQDSRGVTLMELMVSLAILSAVLGVLGTAFTQALITRMTVSDASLAITEQRKSLSWFAEDVKGAKSAVLGGCGSATLTLNWDEYSGPDLIPHNICYSVAGDRLMRNYDGTAYPIARNVVPGSVSFSVCCPGDVPPNRNVGVSLQLDVDGTIRGLSHQTQMRVNP